MWLLSVKNWYSEPGEMPASAAIAFVLARSTPSRLKTTTAASRICSIRSTPRRCRRTPAWRSIRPP